MRGGAVTLHPVPLPVTLAPSTLSPFTPRQSERPRAAERGNARAPISAIVLTKDSARYLEEVLGALAWCDEVIVFDTGSSDATLSIAAAFANVSLHQLVGRFPGFGVVRQHAVKVARHDWILAVDSDEVVTPELADEIAALQLDPHTIYVLPFENFYQGKHITTCGWSPDCHERLFNRTTTNFCSSAVHEKLRTDGLRLVTLRKPIRHYSYSRPQDFLRKMAVYSDLFAAQNRAKKRASITKAAARGTWAFFKSYILERGCLQGAEGLIISAYKSHTVFWKYVCLRDAQRCES